MEHIGKQVNLGFRRALRIALQGIRIRFGRSLVTVSGVVLGIAFLMSNLTGQIIQKAVSSEREQRQTVSLMVTMVQSEVGAFEGKPIAILAAGKLNAVEEKLLKALSAAKLQRGKAEGSSLLLVLGDAKAVESSLEVLTAGMNQKVVLDSLRERNFAAGGTEVRRELFFGQELEQQAEELRQKAIQQLFRTRWIILVSLLVTVIGVSNALLMSVTERFREIGTMKCLGALSRFIRVLFLIESSVLGMVGSAIGMLAGATLSLVVYGATYGFGLVIESMPFGLWFMSAIGAVVAGTVLSILAAIYPATFAARMVPASALRSTV